MIKLFKVTPVPYYLSWTNDFTANNLKCYVPFLYFPQNSKQNFINEYQYNRR